MADDTHSGPVTVLGETVAELLTEAIAIAARRGRSLTSVTLKGQHPLLVENLGRACLAQQGFAHVTLQVEPGIDPVRLAAVQTEPQGRPRGPERPPPSKAAKEDPMDERNAEPTTLNRAADEPTVTDGRPQVSIAVDSEQTAMDVRPPAADKDPIRMLLAFHKRIRLAFKTLARLSRQPRNAIDSVEVGALYEFFAVELAAHDLDEEASLMSRLRRTEHPPRLDKLLAACTKQHERLETAIEAALPHLQAVAEKRIQPDPERLAQVRDELARIIEPHLNLEEQEIFPLARLLITGKDEEEMFDEMVARRRRREANKPSAVAL